MKRPERKQSKENVVPAAEELDPEFAESWMSEQGLKHGEEWVELKGWTEKDFCEVKLHGGKTVGPCFHHAGNFVSIENGTKMPEYDVTHVRYYKHDVHLVGRDDEQEDDD